MTAPELVSVVIPVYNAGAYIAQAIDSALGQTHRAIEVIVVDDGSTDDTMQVLERYGDRITVLKQNRGRAAKARNTAAARAKGTWLAFLDADDVWLPNKIERQLAMVGNAPMAWTDRINIGVLAGLPEIHSELQPMYSGDVFLDLLLTGNVITTSSVLLRRDLFERLGGFSEDPELPPAEDWDLWVRVAAEHPIAACREPLVRYRLHAEGASRDARRMSRARYLVTERALALPRGRSIGHLMRRRIWARTWMTNAWDAARGGSRTSALKDYARSIVAWPFYLDQYKGITRVCLGRS